MLPNVELIATESRVVGSRNCIEPHLIDPKTPTRKTHKEKTSILIKEGMKDERRECRGRGVSCKQTKRKRFSGVLGRGERKCLASFQQGQGNLVI